MRHRAARLLGGRRSLRPDNGFDPSGDGIVTVRKSFVEMIHVDNPEYMCSDDGEQMIANPHEKCGAAVPRRKGWPGGNTRFSPWS